MRPYAPENVDDAAGDAVGLTLGRQRLGNRLVAREPLEHFGTERRRWWRIGYEAVLRMRARRITIAVWDGGSRTDQGHVNRTRIINRLAKQGVTGDVWVSYHDVIGMLSEQRCGI
ncbi:hypothetical protein CCR95_17110 [Thiocystis minor]|uniref:hypothetical protein n=1 Tax=Thiocystis minor TaxID=61597 RepID=UPI00191320CA|nr:hypothetical protein [Thiocystis minor]MBK5965752.1 hypothetical protein [Thiocystis minor]